LDKANVLESNNAFTQIFIQYEIKKAPTVPFLLFKSMEFTGMAFPPTHPQPERGMIHVLK
jgi:hypothetical protein